MRDKVVEYLREDGTSPCEEWFKKDIDRAEAIWEDYKKRKARQKRK